MLPGVHALPNWTLYVAACLKNKAAIIANIIIPLSFIYLPSK